MKQVLIQNLHTTQLAELTKELFDFIQLTYGIHDADTRLIAFFVKVVKENYDHLNFEQLHDAFERNSLGYLDNFFTKVGQRPDNKIRSFNIPDLTKIINAYVKYKSIEKEEDPDKIIVSEEEKARSNIWWCDFMQGCFDLYKEKKERTKIDCSMFAAEKLAEFGLLGKDEIVYENVAINFKSKHSSKNEKLIYEVFDALILQNESFAPYLAKQRNKYQTEGMPC